MIWDGVDVAEPSFIEERVEVLSLFFTTRIHQIGPRTDRWKMKTVTFPDRSLILL
jgi:hypothetical protein